MNNKLEWTSNPELAVEDCNGNLRKSEALNEQPRRKERRMKDEQDEHPGQSQVEQQG